MPILGSRKASIDIHVSGGILSVCGDIAVGEECGAGQGKGPYNCADSKCKKDDDSDCAKDDNSAACICKGTIFSFLGSR